MIAFVSAAHLPSDAIKRAPSAQLLCYAAKVFGRLLSRNIPKGLPVAEDIIAAFEQPIFTLRFLT